MPDIGTLIRVAMEDGSFQRLANSPQTQFGQGTRRYIGAELLPERTVESNMFREDMFRLRTIAASDGSHYSPTQLKSGDSFQSIMVECGDVDIRRELTAREYDALLKLLRQGDDMQAMTQLIGWADTTLVKAIAEKAEAERWQAICNAEITRIGDNGYSEVVSFENPLNHRATPLAPWSTVTTDIFQDIHAMVDLLISKGYNVSRIITSQSVVSMMSRNDTIKGNVIADSMISTGRATLQAINAALESDGLPPIERYDLQYRVQTPNGLAASNRFFPNDAFVLIGGTNEGYTLDLGDEEPMRFENTLGYYAVGTVTGMAAPGRKVHVENFESRPPRIEGEAYQSGVPVITYPEAIAVIQGIT